MSNSIINVHFFYTVIALFLFIYTLLFVIEIKLGLTKNNPSFDKGNSLFKKYERTSPPFTAHDYSDFDKVHLEPRDGCSVSGHSIDTFIVYLIKSHKKNYGYRKVIRETWGQEHLFPNIKVKRIFILGLESSQVQISESVYEESETHNDIIVGDFIDHFDNLTLKVVLGMHWFRKHCSHAKYAMVLDDNTCLNPVNLIDYLTKSKREMLTMDFGKLYKLPMKNFYDDSKEEESVRLYAGNVYRDRLVFREKSHKYYVSMTDYPYDTYPPYIVAYAIIMNRAALEDFYEASFFSLFTKCDDVYVGFLSMYSSVRPTHLTTTPQNEKATDINQMRTMIAGHPYSIEQLELAWLVVQQLFSEHD